MDHGGAWLPLATALNLRDLGGLPIAGGGVTRSRTLFRGGSLSRLSEADAGLLLTDFGLRTVVDLRTSAELAAEGPSRLARAGIATAHLPLVADIGEQMRRASTEKDAVRTLAGAYRDFIGRRGEHVVTVARLLSWSARGALLVHCSAGKDRTGVTVAVLLDAVGVQREAVVADYARTNEVIDQVLDALAQNTHSPGLLAVVPLAMRRAHPDALRLVLEELDRTWGGAAGWLLAHGLEPAELTRLRARLIATARAA